MVYIRKLGKIAKEKVLEIALVGALSVATLGCTDVYKSLKYKTADTQRIENIELTQSYLPKTSIEYNNLQEEKNKLFVNNKIRENYDNYISLATRGSRELMGSGLLMMMIGAAYAMRKMKDDEE